MILNIFFGHNLKQISNELLFVPNILTETWFARVDSSARKSVHMR